MVEDKRIKMAVIAGAALAIKYKEKNPFWTESQILQKITKELNSTVEKIEEY